MSDLTKRDVGGIDLTGKVALVTGASSGIGSACAIALAEAGAAVGVNYFNDRAGADQIVSRIADGGGQAIAIHANVAKRDQVQQMYESLEKTFGVADIIVSNAGSSVRRPLFDTTATDLQRTLDVIVFGAFNVLQEGAARMIAAKLTGNMVAIGSVHATIPFRNAITYNVAKAALNQLTLSFAAELLEHRIRVNVVTPGLTDTVGERSFRTEQELQEASRQLPLGRMATVEEIARLIRFIVSDQNSYMTGALVTADGGIGVNLSGGLQSQPSISAPA